MLLLSLFVELTSSSQWGPDPHLTPRGVLQASAVNVAWKEQGEAGVPFPQTLYSSPLSRAASTLRITWEDILIKPQGVSPLFREHLRCVAKSLTVLVVFANVSPQGDHWAPHM